MNNALTPTPMATVFVEMTDTFGGEANYSWVKRHEFPMTDEMSDVAVVRKAKALLDMTGVRCKTFKRGDMIELRPCGQCIVIFITWGGV